MKSFIWTECLGCPEIGSVAINSFLLTHHNLTLNVFVYADDLPYLPKHNRIVYHTFFDSSKFLLFALKFQSRFSKVFQPSESLFRSYFKKGHKGTSLLWAYILKKYSFCDTLIHFDSDVVFIDNAIDRLLSLSDEYDFIGQCRPYKNNLNNDFVRSYPDLVQTCCFLFKPSLIPSIYRLSQRNLALAIQGRNKITGHSLLDFFDQLSYEALSCGARFYFMDVEDFGGFSPDGSRKSNFSSFNDYPTKYKIDVGRYLIHFSAVGSGYNIWKNSASSGSSEYDKYALDRFALFMKCFYPSISFISSDIDQYAGLDSFFDRLPVFSKIRESLLT